MKQHRNKHHLAAITFAFAMFVPTFAYCDGENFLFYNATTRGGAVGRLTGNEFTTTKIFPDGAFGKWTHITCTDSMHSLLFYNRETGAGADGFLDRGDFKTKETFRNGIFGKWTHILDGNFHHRTVHLPLFYNAATGSGAIGYAPTIRQFPDSAFARGWTHIVATGPGLLFYNSRTGQGAVAVPIDSSPNNAQNIDDIRTVKIFNPGDFATNWTHVVSGDSDILFYNSADGSGAIGRLAPPLTARATTFRTNTVIPAGSFARGWTHIVAAERSNKFLFYKGGTGEGAIGKISNGRFETIKIYPKNSFAKGWTHIVAGSHDTPPASPPR